MARRRQRRAVRVHLEEGALNATGRISGASGKKLVGRLFTLALTVGHAPSFERDHREALGMDWAQH
jgi:hypothetical protein